MEYWIICWDFGQDESERMRYKVVLGKRPALSDRMSRRSQVYARLPSQNDKQPHFMDIQLTLPQYHNESVLKKYQDRLKVGTLKESSKL